MGGIGGLQHSGPLGADLLGPAVVDVGGVWKPIPEWRCSVLYQPKNRVQKPWASSKEPNRSGNSGRCLRVLNWASE
jgi:hypothetical protein